MTRYKKHLIILVLIIELFSLFLTYKSFSNKDVNKIKEIYKVDKKMFAMYIENPDTGDYDEYLDSTTFPEGYVINKDMTTCVDNKGNSVDNNILSYTGNKLTVSSSKTLFCYLYFDLPGPDVTIENVDTTKLNTSKYIKSLDCGETGSATFNTKYQRVEFGNVIAPAECKMKYTEDTNSYPKLNQYIIDMAVEGTSDGTNQAEGDVVHETFKIVSNDATYTKLTQSEYANITNTSTYPFVWDETNNQWTQSATSVSTTSDFKYYPSEAGGYQVCYTLPASASATSGNYYKNTLNMYLNSTSLSEVGIISNNNSGSTLTGCYNFYYLTTNDYIYIKGKYYDNNVSFYIQKTDDIDFIDKEYRYEGKTPNNYIWFNNELWRIIGIFDTCTELDDSDNCTKIETLTKIIRNTSVGGKSWDYGSSNNWATSDLYNLLNMYYLNSNNGSESGYCYTYNVSRNCDYSAIGLKGNHSYYGSMVKNVVWYLGGVTSSRYITYDNYYQNPASLWYQFERGNLVVSGNPNKTIGYIGLMYASDYGFSVKADSNCNRNKILTSYNTAYCAGESWLYGQGYEPLINPLGIGGNKNYYIDDSGSVGIDDGTSRDGFAVRPVLYLDSSVYKTSGDGSITNPYQIGI